MQNRQLNKQTPEKMIIKSNNNYYNPNREILPKLYKASEFLSSHNLNGSNKSSQNSTDDNDSLFIKNKIVSNKSRSVTSLFESASDDDYQNVKLNSESFHKSLKLSIESMVYGEKLQMNSELLLLSSSDLWPLSLNHLNKVNRDFCRFADCYDELLESLKIFEITVSRFEKVILCFEYPNVSVDDKINRLTDIVKSAVTIMELTYQTIYTISASQLSWKKSQSGLLERKTIISAIDEVELCCFRFREILLRSTNSEDYSHKDVELNSVMLHSCSQFSSSLTYLAMCCRTASASVDMALKLASNKHQKSSKHSKSEDNLFHLSMKSVSMSSQCMLASVKNYVHVQSPGNRFITESFTNSVSSSVKALASMATSPQFVGYPSVLPPNIKMTRNAICGSCISLVSPTIQLLQTVSAIYSPNNTMIKNVTATNFEQLLQRAITCIAAIRDARMHFCHTLNLYQTY